jgi:carbon monoxide dehydrogenase subunit G
MLIEGTKILGVPRDAVWRALNDPVFLQTVIPGCRRVAEPSPGQLVMELGAAVGPIKANFAVEAQKLEVVEGESYVLAGKGSAGVAGAASGRARLRLSDVPGGTQLDYSAETEITGRVAQLGARMIDSTARKFSEEFFANVARAMAGDAPKSRADAVSPATAPAAFATRASPVAPGAVQASGGIDAALGRLALDGIVWRLALGCAAGSFVGTLVAAIVVRGGL